MFTLNKSFLVILLISIALLSGNSESREVTNVEKNIVDTKPAQAAVLTQLKITRSGTGDAIYSYKCTVGTYSSNRLACADRNTNSWPSAHNVELKLRCPDRGSGLSVSYVEIIYSVSSPSVNCFVNEGAVGLGYIGITIQAWNTLLFTYSANFYSY